MKINLLILMFFICSPFFAQIVVEGDIANRFASFPELENMDKTDIECIYEYNVTDPELDRTNTHFDILQIGRNHTKFFGYPMYQTDSVIYKMNINKITFRKFGEIRNQYNVQSDSPYTIFKNNQTKIITYFDRVFADKYVYSDSVSFDWKLSIGTKEVCGYLCQKATTRFRGREWIAYYTTEIPKSEGPWKFSGLPGLILQIEDSTGYHRFTAITIRNAHSDIYIAKKDSFRTNRKRFNKQLSDYKNNPNDVISGSQLAPKDASGKEIPMPKRKLFHNPIELE